MRRLTLLLLAAVLIAGCGSTPKLKKVVLTDQVDEYQAPVRAVASFPEGARALYVSVLVADPLQGTEVKVRWQLADHLIDEYELTMPDRKDRWVSFHLKATNAFPAGRYQAQVFLDGSPVQTLSFRIGPES